MSIVVSPHYRSPSPERCHPQMDPFSVIGFIDLIVRYASQLNDRFEKFRGLPSAKEALGKEVLTIQSVCQNLRRELEELHEYSPLLTKGTSDALTASLDAMKTEIDSCYELFDRLEAFIPQGEERKARGMRFCNIKEVVRPLFRAETLQGLINGANETLDRIRLKSLALLHLAVTLRVSQPPQDGQIFKPQYDLPARQHNIVLDFDLRPSHGPRAPEADLKAHVLKTVDSGAPQINAAFGVNGMGGVGKTTAMVALAYDEDIQKAFPGGIYFLSFGQHVSPEKVRRQLSSIVRHTGGPAEEVCNTPSLDEAMQCVSRWFKDRNALFLCDDLWSCKESPVGYMGHLKNLATSRGNCVVTTTRDRKIARAAGTFTSFAQQKEYCGSKAFAIFAKHANFPEKSEDLERWAQSEDVRHVLTACAGLPLTLAVAGAAISENFWHTLERDDAANAWGEAVHMFSRRLLQDEAGSAISREDLSVDERPNYNLFATLKASLASADDIINSNWGASREGPRISCPNLFLSLCALPRQEYISEDVLQHLWPKLEAHVLFKIVDTFCRMNLMSMRATKDGVASYGVYDLILDYASYEAKRNSIFERVHLEVLDSYASTFFSETEHRRGRLTYYRPWWELRVDDGFILPNLALLLSRAGLQVELMSLISDARWCYHRMRCTGIISLQQDFDVLLSSLEENGLPQGVEDLEESLILLRSAVGFISTHTEEMATQASALLRDNALGGSELIERFLETSTLTTPRPFFLPLNRYWEETERSACLSVPLGARNFLVAADFSKQVTYSVQREYLNEVSFKKHGVVIERKSLAQDNEVCVSITSDGNQHAFISNNGHLSIWNRQENTVSFTVPLGIELYGSINALRQECKPLRIAWAENSDFIALLSDNDELFTICLRTSWVAMWHAFPKASAIHVSSSGRFVICGTTEGSVSLYDLFQRCVVWTRTGAHEKEIDVVTCDGKADLSASGSWESIKIWRGRDGELIKVLPMTTDFPSTMHFAENGTWFVTTTVHGKARWYSVPSFEIVTEYTAQKNFALSTVLSPDGNTLASVGENGLIRWWNQNAKPLLQPTSRSKEDRDGIWFMSSSSNGSCVAAVEEIGSSAAVTVFDVRDPVNTAVLGTPAMQICAIAVSPDGMNIVTGNWYGEIACWDVATPSPFKIWKGSTKGPIYELVTSNRCERIFSVALMDFLARIWDGTKGTCVASCSVEFKNLSDDYEKLSFVASSLNAERISLTTGRQLLFFMNLQESGEEFGPSYTFEGAHAFTSVGMSGNGRLVVTADKTSCVHVRLFNSATVLWKGENVHGSTVPWGVALNHDGSLLCTGGVDRKLRLFQSRGDDEKTFSPTAVASLPEPISSLAFVDEGIPGKPNYVAVGDGRGDVISFKVMF